MADHHAYTPETIEPKWQEYWRREGLHSAAEAASDAETQYILEMFPYPSAAGLHVGHVESYTAGDIYARYLQRHGYAVLHPMGWDAFGLPAENYAIKTGIHPQETTDGAIQTFRQQIQRLGLSYDWEREVGTHQPEYYRWTQWLFLQLYRNGLAYRGMGAVNWCPSCQTVLANEQVVEGACERCKTEVVEKEMEQWFFNTVSYADQLIDDLDDLDWPESTKQAQRNWIGRSEGATIRFQVSADSEQYIDVFTTRPDTLYGVTYMVLAPEHALVEQMREHIENWPEVAEYVREAGEKTETQRTADTGSKSGVRLEGITATHPETGEQLPVFVADYVLAKYGTGAVMGVPAHDERDYAFAQVYDLPVRHVVAPTVVDTVNAPREDKPTGVRHNVHAIVYSPQREAYLALHNSEHGWTTVVIGGIEDGEDAVAAARREVREETGFTELTYQCQLGGPVKAKYFAPHKDENREAISQAVYLTLEDETAVEREEDAGEIVWIAPEDFRRGTLINSELDYWTARLPKAGSTTPSQCVYAGDGELINSGDCDGMTSAEARRAITEQVGGEMTRTYKLRDWLVSRQRYWGAPIPIVYDPDGQPHPVPEEHLPWTLPDDVEFRPTGTAPLAQSQELRERTERLFGAGWRPEVDTLDTFVDSSWYYIRYADPRNETALADSSALQRWLPVNCYIGGAEHTVLHLLYARFITKALRDLGHLHFGEPFQKLRHQGVILGEDGHKMSKSRGNVINPDEIIHEHGADTLRLYEMFMGPLEETKPWDSRNVKGVQRFLRRSWQLLERAEAEAELPQALHRTLHQTIAKISADIPAFKFNTAISQLMICLNALEEHQRIPADAVTTFVQLLAPFAPHIAEEMWQQLGHTPSVHRSSWPQWDSAAMATDTVQLAVQIDGKVRTTITVAQDASEETVRAAIPQETWDRWVQSQGVARFVYVPGKIVSIATHGSI